MPQVGSSWWLPSIRVWITTILGHALLDLCSEPVYICIKFEGSTKRSAQEPSQSSKSANITPALTGLSTSSLTRQFDITTLRVTTSQVTQAPRLRTMIEHQNQFPPREMPPSAGSQRSTALVWTTSSLAIQAAQQGRYRC